MKIASWNVSCFRVSKSASFEFDYDKENPNYFIDIIEGVNPDVICLQENYTNDKESFSRRIADKVDFKYILDAPGSISYFNKVYRDTNSILSKFPLEFKKNIKTENPKWEHTFADGYHGTSYDEYFQVVKIKDHYLTNAHFLPEKTFEKDYSKGIGNEYFEKALSLFEPYPLSFLIGDFNTVSLDSMLKRFAKKKDLKNVFKDIGTRPIPGGDVVIEDAIFAKKNIPILKKGVVKTRNDHYLIWIEF